MARIGVQRWSLNRRMRACVTLCHSLCTCTTARSPVVFLGNGFIPLMRLDIYDHMLSITLISGALCWPQEDINRRIGKKPLAYPGLKTTISANAWLSMCGSLWGPRMWSVYFCALRPPWYQLSPLCSHCWHIPLRGLPLRGRSVTSLGLMACRLKKP